jgi:hypothetical protein
MRPYGEVERCAQPLAARSRRAASISEGSTSRISMTPNKTKEAVDAERHNWTAPG